MITKDIFGQLPDGQTVERYCLTNGSGVSVGILNLGGIIQRWRLGDKNDTDIVLGFDDLEGYLKNDSYLGATIGRYANRIGQGRFTLNDTEYKVSVNLQGNSLHGGEEGFDKRIWQVTVISEGDAPSIELALTSRDGDQGFPGTLKTQVRFTLTQDNGLRIEYRANTDKDTVFNPTQHSYFNLAGHHSGNVKGHRLQVLADHFTPADETGIPTGEIQQVSGSDFDLRQLKSIETLLTGNDPRLKMTEGLDHNWCLNNSASAESKVATVIEPVSGRTMEVFTDMPGMQVYTANFLSQNMEGKNGAKYGPYHAFCLETQFYPDSPNKEQFPSSMIKAGEAFYSITEYRLTL